MAGGGGRRGGGRRGVSGCKLFANKIEKKKRRFLTGFFSLFLGREARKKIYGARKSEGERESIRDKSERLE